MKSCTTPVATLHSIQRRRVKALTENKDCYSNQSVSKTLFYLNVYADI